MIFENNAEPFGIRSPAALIVMASLIAKRDQKGPKWCKAKGVGAVRKALGAPLPDAVPVNPAVREFWKAQRAAHEILRAQCRICAQCSLGEREPSASSHSGRVVSF
jgi:hypothetical protein